MVNWNQEYETGHALMDAQHRMLISYVNRLDGLCRTTNPGREEFELFLRFMEFLEDFIPEHFRKEEDCMLRFRCPAYQEAHAAHQEFLSFYQGFKSRFGIMGYRVELVRQLFDACLSFIQRHILGTDVQLRLCMTKPVLGVNGN